MTKNLFSKIALGLIILSATTVFAQSERNKVEFFGGFSHIRADTGLTSEDLGSEFDRSFGRRFGAHGFNASITGNVTDYVGVKFDVATHGRSEDITFDGDDFRLKYRITNYLGGIQIKNNKKEGSRVRPFAHLLAGVANQSADVSGTAITTTFGGPFKVSENNFALALGGGLDVNVSKRVAIRVFQVDYNPTFVKDRDFEDFTLDGQVQQNIRFSFGVVIH
jgi:opacity protein-like surface antigen